MRTKFILTLLLSLLLIGAVRGGEEGKKEFISLDFNQVDINLVIKFISELTGTNFIVDPKVKGQVTIICPSKIPVEAAYAVFKSILEMHGFSLVQAGEMVKIIRSVEAKQKAVRTEVGKEIERVSPEDIIVTQLIPLEYADANQVKAILAPLVSKASNMVSHLPTNTLILTETSSNIQRLLKIVKEIDVQGVRIEREVIPLKFAFARALVSTLTSTLERRQRGKKVPEKVLKVIPEERTNCLIVVASAEDMKDIKELIEKLDKETPTALSRVNVYYLENADSGDLAKVLANLAKQPARREPKKGGPAEIKPSIVSDKATNALIITASPEDHAMFRSIIEKLDIMRKQVLVEMLIAEVSMDITQELGVELASGENLLEPADGKVRGFGGTTFTGALASLAAGQPIAGSGLTLGIIKGKTGEYRNTAGIIQAYRKDEDFNILATPHLLTLDNEEATIKIGETVPYVKQSREVGVEAGALPSFVHTWDYKDVGIDLKITPQISQKRFVRLELEGKITELKGPLTDHPRTIHRETKTVVSVEDGSTVVIGGLTRDDKSKTVHKVPLLGDIPVLRWLFRRTAETIVKKNLLIFITPHVIDSVEEAQEITREKSLEQEKFMESRD